MSTRRADAEPTEPKWGVPVELTHDEWSGQSFGAPHPNEDDYREDGSSATPWTWMAYHHYFVVEQADDGGFRAHCACGWRGPKKPGHHAAATSGKMHRARAGASGLHRGLRPKGGHEWLPRF